MCSNVGRSVVLEMNGLNGTVLDQIGKSVSEVVLLLTNRWPKRQTFTHLSLHLIECQINQLVPLSHIRSQPFADNYFKLLSNLNAFRFKRNGFEFNANYGQNIEIMLRQMRESVKQMDIKCFEVTYVCVRPLDQVLQDLCRVFTDRRIDTSFVEMFNILSIVSKEEPVFRPLVCGPSGSVDQRMNYKIPEAFEPFFETETIEDNECSIDGYFKVWLHDLNVHSERIRIHIDSKNEDFVIKCDVKEAIVDLKAMSCAKNGKPLDSSVDICDTNGSYDLRVVGLIGREGLCDSVIYGIPYILSATRNSSLNYSELDVNLNRFHGLIEVMIEKNSIIVLQTIETTQHLCPKAFFALISTPMSKTLLMKAIATKELLLPTSCDSIERAMQRPVTQSVVASVREHLNAVPFADNYNPLNIRNGLFKYLSLNLSQSFV